MKKIAYYLLALVLAISAGCSSENPPPPTAKHVDLHRYTGRWYEIASLPNYFQKGCRCTFAEYALKGSTVSVVNRCIKNKNSYFSSAKGKAWTVDKESNSKLKVQFFWPFTGDYWILYLDPHYQYALVGSPNRKYLWILSRQKVMSNSTYQRMLMLAKQKGYSISKLKKTTQNCSN